MADPIVAGYRGSATQYAPEDTAERLEHLRAQLRAECISWGELAELQGLAGHIDAGDVELLDAAGVPEFHESGGDDCAQCRAGIVPDDDDNESEA